MSNQQTIAEIREELKKIRDINDPLFHLYLQDSRKGVQQLVQTRMRQIENYMHQKEAFYQRLQFEKAAQKQGAKLIAGVDEVGRGPIAGPVVASAVVFHHYPDELIEINDSKQLSASKRQQLIKIIKEFAYDTAIGIASVEEIDRLNIYQASRLAMLRAVSHLNYQPDHLLVDAMTINSPITQQAIIKGDQRSISIAAASILAKEYRDQLMVAFGESYPEFGFEKHMGYPTKQHLRALEQVGKTEIHRESFGPVQKINKKYTNF